MAITGVTCTTEASGRIARSASGLSAVTSARAWAIRLARTRAITAVDSVPQAAPSRTGKWSRSATATADGGGRK